MRRATRIIFPFIVFGHVLFGGEYAGAFMDLDVSARALAMGNALGALDFSATSAISNPAGIAYVKQKYAGFMYHSLFGMAYQNYLGFAAPVSKKTSIAASWLRFSVDDIPIRPDILREVTDPVDRRDSIIALNGQVYDTFGDAENALVLTFGRFSSRTVDLGWRYSKFLVEIPLGISFKLIQKNLYNLKGYGLGIDLGGRFRVDGDELFDIRKLGKIGVGLSLRDLTGTTIYWNSKRQDKIKIAALVSFALEQPIEQWQSQINIGIEKNLRYDEKFRYGIEFNYHDRLQLRAGLGITAFTCGMGLNIRVAHIPINLDYAYMNHDLGSSHRIGGGITF